MVGTAQGRLCPPYGSRRQSFGVESGGQFGEAFSGSSPLCTVGAAESVPPASGSTALLPTVTEFDVFSSPLPDVAAGDVVQAVSSFSPDGAVDWADAVLTPITAAKIAAATRVIFSLQRLEKQLARSKTFCCNEGSG
jgi:hypothetical protein